MNNLTKLEMLRKMKNRNTIFQNVFINLNNFGGFVFINRQLFEPYGIGERSIINGYMMICTCLNNIEYEIFKPFKNKLNPKDYHIYKFGEYELYINKENLKKIEYTHGGYLFQFVKDDEWFIKCEENEIKIKEKK